MRNAAEIAKNVLYLIFSGAQYRRKTKCFVIVYFLAMKMEGGKTFEFNYFFSSGFHTRRLPWFVGLLDLVVLPGVVHLLCHWDHISVILC